ncbi:MAG: IclR family transcriptional regulator [Caldimonas sp.]
MARGPNATPSRPVAPASQPDHERGSTGSSAERSLRLLGLLADEGRPMSLAGLSTRLGLPKGTTHRICLQLRESGFLARDVDERHFSVGPKLRDLAFATLNHGVVRGLRHQVLAQLVDRIGETCNFTTQDGTEVLYLDRVEAKWPLRLTLDVGSHVPLHCTASGKLFLSMMAADAREDLIDRLALPRMTRATLTTKKALRAECAEIASCGYACDREEFIAGLIAVAVPVVAPLAAPVKGRRIAGDAAPDAASGSASVARAAIAVHAPTARMSLAQALASLPALQDAAARMHALL